MQEPIPLADNPPSIGKRKLAVIGGAAVLGIMICCACPVLSFFVYKLLPLGDGASALRKENLLGEWEGSLQDGTTVALLFTDELVVVSILAPGSNREKSREAAKWVSGNPVRSLGGGGTGIGSTAYKIDAEKGEVKFGHPEPTAVGKLGKDGALVVSGELKTANFTAKVPETRLVRAKD